MSERGGTTTILSGLRLKGIFFLHSAFPDEIRNGNCLPITRLSLWGRYTYQVHVGVKESNDKNTREVKRGLSFSFSKLSDHSQRHKNVQFRNTGLTCCTKVAS